MSSIVKNQSGLPKGWAISNLENIIDRISNGTTIKQNKEGVGIPVTRIETISNGTIDFDRVGYIKELTKDLISKFKLIPGDILFSHINSDLHLGKTALFDFENITVLHGMNLLLIRPTKSCAYSKFLNYFFHWLRFNGKFISIAQHAVNQSSINQKKLKNLSITLPPLPEQHRIVAKIEELFTKLDAGVENLKQVQAQLKRYRQSVLKSAVEGRLTAEWRQQHKNELKPANKLLERIQDERKAKLGKKYKEPMPVDASYLPELPEEWSVSSVGILYDIIGGGTPSTKVGEYWDGDNPWLTSADISDKGKISPRKSITQEGIENSATNLVPKNSLIVVTRVGLGKVALTDFPLCFSQDSQALVGSENYINPKFAFYYLLRAVQTFKYRSRGTTISGVTKKQLFELPFSIPPYQEQQEITNRIERIYSAIDASELIIISELKRAQSLRQSILKRAFEGKLVPQDPNDEPASILLERIKAEKAKSKKSKQLEMS